MNPYRPPGPRVCVVGELDPVTAAAIGHVLLGYDYVARHDVDGLLSLVEPDIAACLVADPGDPAAPASCFVAPMDPEVVVAICPSVLVVKGTVPVPTAPDRAPDVVVDTVVAGSHGLIRSCHRTWTTPHSSRT